ncbi:dnaJ homolog subfamily C member 9-like [Lineus longissimus]|uniref:dnaJ homolog subfamily C member 9-like n=1 Tax=Lineus longissimus TaxID=88925 RepID=UPI002B4D3C74
MTNVKSSAICKIICVERCCNKFLPIIYNSDKMPSLFETCDKLFDSKNFYEVFSIPKTASASQVKKSYHKLSLRCHPDRVSIEDKDEATEKFQTIGKIYCILSDEEKRKVYDETGEIDEENDIPPDRDWYDYWRLVYHKISPQEIEEFTKEYQGSDEELDDLKSAYMDFEGNMDEILDNIMCSTIDDEPRFRKILTKLIKKKELPEFEAFSNEKKKTQKARKRRANTEAAEAEQHAKDIGLVSSDGDVSLMAMIKKNQASREQQSDNFFSMLEKKYSKPEAKAGGSKKKEKK